MKDATSLYYTAALNGVDSGLEVAAGEVVTPSHRKVQEAYDNMSKEIMTPWMSQANKRRRHQPPHWNNKFLKVLAWKKLLYEGLRWKRNLPNARAYKEVCREAQKLERQLKRERQRRNLQRIQANPEAEIAVEIRRKQDVRKSKKALNQLTGSQMTPKDFDVQMRSKLDLQDEDIEIEEF